MIIDFHTHTFPRRIAEAAVAKLSCASHIAPFSDGTDEGLLASMARAGIDASVVLPVATNPCKLRSMNDAIVALPPDSRLIRFGAMHPDAPDWREELNRLAASGVKGIKLHPVYQDVAIDDPRNLRILERAGELGLVVVMHAGDDLGFPGVVRCAPAMTARALSQVGPVRLVAAHMGGWRNWAEAEALAEHASLFIDTAFSLGSFTPLDDGCFTARDAALLDAQAFVRLVRIFGARRVLFATDSPWADQAETVRRMEALPLTAQEKRAIFAQNALALLQMQ